jgi:hypothetical protein
MNIQINQSVIKFVGNKKTMNNHDPRISTSPMIEEIISLKVYNDDCDPDASLNLWVQKLSGGHFFKFQFDEKGSAPVVEN